MEKRPALKSAVWFAIFLLLPALSHAANESSPAKILSYLRATKVEGIRSTWDFAHASVPPSKRAPAIVVLYLTNADWCGSGGCTLLILSAKNGHYSVLSKIPGIEYPITLLDRGPDGFPIFGLHFRGFPRHQDGTADLLRGVLKPKNGAYPSNGNGIVRYPQGLPFGRVLISQAEVLCNFRHLPPGEACGRLLRHQGLEVNF